MQLREGVQVMPGTMENEGCICRAAGMRFRVLEEWARAAAAVPRSRGSRDQGKSGLLLTQLPDKKRQVSLHGGWDASASSPDLQKENYRTRCSPGSWS